MWVYYIIFFFVSYASLVAPRSSQRYFSVSEDQRWYLVFVILVLIIGFRQEVGGDWTTYEEHYRWMTNLPLEIVLQQDEILYWLVVWLAAYLDISLYASNTVFAIIFAYCLVYFCRQQPRSWLALCVSIPYLVIVVAMGYTRQSVTVGLCMVALVAIQNGNGFRSIILISIAAFFHRTALLMLPILLFCPPRGRIFIFISITVVGAALYRLVLADRLDLLIENYIVSRYQSDGALVRGLMNALPAILFLSARNRITSSVRESNLWTAISIASIVSLIWLQFFASSTVVDRLNLYFIPLQIYFFSRMPDLFGRSSSVRGWIFLIVIYYGLVLTVWLNFGNYASSHWIPYQFRPLNIIFE